ncbi:MAG: GWxTD domain-containing protein, partial [Thermoanaerobaculia bacterium]|nr:GWxTD domain-containing protein [Thermoanaerobaculia bacterium]
MKRSIPGVLIALAIAGSVFGALSEKYEQWADGPVKWIMTEEEKSEWKAIETDEAASEFVELFWVRRDPTPATAINEARLAFKQRVYDADDYFSFGTRRGSLTDRGRVFLLLGPPETIDRRTTNPPSEVWYYGEKNRPAVMSEGDLNVYFTDELGRNEFRLAAVGKERVEGLLEESKAALVVQPSLETVPEYEETAETPGVAIVEVEEVGTEFASEALESAYREFRTEPESEGRIGVTYGEFVTPAGQYYVPVQVYVSAGEGLDTRGELTFFGVIEDEEGEIVAVYEEPATLLASRADAYYDKSLMLEPGKYVG